MGVCKAVLHPDILVSVGGDKTWQLLQIKLYVPFALLVLGVSRPSSHQVSVWGSGDIVQLVLSQQSGSSRGSSALYKWARWLAYHPSTREVEVGKS